MADLRFGHDSYIGPLTVLMGIRFAFKEVTQVDAKHFQLAGVGGKMHIFGVKVKHDCADFQEYAKGMKEVEMSVLSSICRDIR